MLTLVDAEDGKVQNILVSSLSNFLEHFENLAEIQNRQNFPQPHLEKIHILASAIIRVKLCYTSSNDCIKCMSLLLVHCVCFNLLCVS